MKKFIISMAVTSLLLSNMGFMTYADDKAIAEEVLTEEQTTKEQTTTVTESVSKETTTQESVVTTKNTDNTVLSDNGKEVTGNTDAETETTTSAKDVGSTSTTVSAESTTESTTEATNKNKKKHLTEKENTDKEADTNKDKTEKEAQKQERIENKTEKLEAINKLRETKLLVKATKIEGLTYLKEIRSSFKDIDKEDRQEVLSELAELKNELQDYSVDTFLNGVYIDYEKYDNIKPVIENGRTLVPIRAISESLGAEVSWDESSQKITIVNDGTNIEMTIGSTIAYVDGVEVTLDTAPEIRNGRTLVPVRFIAESFGLNVEWDEDSSSIIIE